MEGSSFNMRMGKGGEMGRVSAGFSRVLCHRSFFEPRSSQMLYDRINSIALS